jgi:hypothetical protein
MKDGRLIAFAPPDDILGSGALESALGVTAQKGGAYTFSRTDEREGIW